jgi:hypothetical protein
MEGFIKSLILLYLFLFINILFAQESLELLLELDKGMPGSDDFGYSVSYAGDFNKDSYDDIIVGYPSNNKGSVYIYFGGRQMDSKADFTIIGRNKEGFLGKSVSFAGDVNSDGFSDIIISAIDTSEAGTYTTNKAELYFGYPLSIIDTLPGLTFSDGKIGSAFGNYVKYAGDFNDDGYDDFIISAFLDYKNGTQAGRAYLYFGGPYMGTIPEIIFTGEAEFNFFGECITSAGDVNADGFSDIAIGAPGYEADGEKVGRVYIYYGNNTLDSNPDVVITGSGSKRIGSTIACAGDINNDGFDDIIVGAPYMGSAIGPSSYIYIYYGGTDMDDKVDVIIEKTLFNFGKRASNAANINDDDYDDIMVCDENNVYFYFGGSEMDTIPDITLYISNYFDGIQSISLAGDVNNDGYYDILINAFEPDTGDTRLGKVYIYSGNFNTTAIKSGSTVTKNFVLYQNYPNPFNPSTTINYTLPADAKVVIKVYDILGKEISELVNEFKSAGKHSVQFDGSNFSSGVYFYRLQSGTFIGSQKFTLLK